MSDRDMKDLNEFYKKTLRLNNRTFKSLYQRKEKKNERTKESPERPCSGNPTTPL